MSHPKSNARLTFDLRKYDNHKRRLLSNELRDLDAIRDRQEKSMTRDQMEIRRELQQLAADKRKQNFAKLQQAKSRVKSATGIQVMSTLSTIRPRRNLNIIQSSLSSRYQENKASQTVDPQSVRPPVSLSPLNLKPDSQQHLVTVSIRKQEPLPRLHRTDSHLDRSASMISIMSANSIANKEKRLNLIATASKLEVRNTKSQSTQVMDEIGLVEHNNKPGVRFADRSQAQSSRKISNDESNEISRQSRAYIRSAVEIPTALDELDDEATGEEEGMDITQIRERTTLKLKQFLTEQGIDIAELPDSIATLSEEIIAMRNLGKSNDEVWEDVRNCRYLRGYEPPLMVLPDQNDPSRFVFGKSSHELYQQHLLRIARQVKAAKERRDAEAKAATYTLTKPTTNELMQKQQYRRHMSKFM